MWMVVLGLAVGLALGKGIGATEPSPATARLYLPIVWRPAPPTHTPTPSPTPTPLCWPIPGATYGTLTIVGSPSDRPAEAHADLNLALRGYTPAVGAYVGLLDNCWATPDDSRAPQLRGLFADRRRPVFVGVYWVYQWDWACNCRSTRVEDRWGPSFAKVAVTPGEVLYVPESGYSIDAQGYEVLVLYAGEERITLKYTREDNVVQGYTLHLEDICVDPNLLALYRACNAGGRWILPALRARHPLGHARGEVMGLAIRDSGNWMDPRHCADWWRLP
jgi:hypothetical protein